MKKTARAHTNIALIKYWGKSNQALKTPLMSSLSMTLDAFYTDTTFEHDSSLTEDTFILNGQKQTPEESKRVFNYIHLLQEKFGFNDHLQSSLLTTFPLRLALLRQHLPLQL